MKSEAVAKPVAPAKPVAAAKPATKPAASPVAAKGPGVKTMKNGHVPNKLPPELDVKSNSSGDNITNVIASYSSSLDAPIHACIR